MNKHVKCGLKVLGVPFILLLGLMSILIQLPIIFGMCLLGITGCYKVNEIADPWIFLIFSWYEQL